MVNPSPGSCSCFLMPSTMTLGLFPVKLGHTNTDKVNSEGPSSPSKKSKKSPMQTKKKNPKSPKKV